MYTSRRDSYSLDADGDGVYCEDDAGGDVDSSCRIVDSASVVAGGAGFASPYSMTIVPPEDSSDPTLYPTGVLQPGEEHIYTIVVPLSSPVTGETVSNEVCVLVDGVSVDTDEENNCDTTTTQIGNFSNVWIEKTGPTVASVG